MLIINYYAMLFADETDDFNLKYKLEALIYYMNIYIVTKVVIYIKGGIHP